jgi:hypothetical protein
MSERRECSLSGIDRSSAQYQHRLSDGADLREELREASEIYRRFGTLLPDPGHLCRDANGSGQSAWRIGTAAHIAHCSAGATAPNPTTDVGPCRMRFGRAQHKHQRSDPESAWHISAAIHDDNPEIYHVG